MWAQEDITVKEYFEIYFSKIISKIEPKDFLAKLDEKTHYLYLGYYSLFKNKRINISQDVGNDNKTDLLFLLHYIEFQIEKKLISYDKGDIIRIGKSHLSNLSDKLYKAICIRFRYCERKRIPNLFREMVGVVTAALYLPVGLAFIIVSALSIWGLDKFCNCEMRYIHNQEI